MTKISLRKRLKLRKKLDLSQFIVALGLHRISFLGKYLSHNAQLLDKPWEE